MSALRRQRGMTLLELLVALSIFALLAAALSPVLTGALASRADATARLAVDAEARAVLDRLEQDLAACFDTGATGQWPPRLVARARDESGGSSRYGARTVVELTTLVARGVTPVDGFVGGEPPASLGDDRGDQAQVAWRIDDDGRLLRHEIKPPRREAVDWSLEAAEVVSESADVVLEFWEPSLWLDAWDTGPSGKGGARLPLAVRTTLAVAGEGGVRTDLVSTVVLPPVASVAPLGGPGQGGGGAKPPKEDDGDDEEDGK